ncbi:MAG: two-component system, OmpR family, sensor histidine kinase VicK [Parcubacteria bacterium C7867-004]|nr:MAG: two-component system, OmpR family, sensor histidine kinase VicK [Parcubacteria bacterium C7867-004]
MTLRVYIGVVLLCVLIVSLGFIGATILFLNKELAMLLTTSVEAEALRTLLLGNAALSIIFSVVMIGFLFWVIGWVVAHPLRLIVSAMREFSETEKPVELPSFRTAPAEVRELASAFTTFSQRVGESHKRDQEISRVKSDFISTAAHQLRTPLTGIRWALEALQKEALTDSQKALLGSATEKSHQLVAIVGTLLDISAIESGKYKYVFENVDVNAFLAQIAKDFQPMALEAKISLFFEQSESEVLQVRADRERIRWVLNNLIENAIRYTPAGGRVRLTTESSQQRTFIHVEDNGIGIAPSDQGNIFERFYRAPNAIAKENGGSGLGLYIARTIATDHGGDLSFTSNAAGHGTTFTLSLPVT